MLQFETKASAHIRCPHCNTVLQEVAEDGYVLPDTFRECPHTVFCFISGNGFEFIREDMRSWLSEQGIDDQDDDFLSRITNSARNPFITQVIKHEEGITTGYYGVSSR